MTSVASLRSRLLAWYDHARRDLPWRAPPGQRTDPYRVWLSEVMLQQTTTVHATPYFLEFTRRWPTVGDLAAAPEAEVMAAWAGLGYYARARNLIACARAVAARGGVFPDQECDLRALPGLGPYTAAAVAAIAFDRPATVVDGNVERVISRLHALEDALPAARARLRALASELTSDERPGDWAQALMDLGAMVCRPRSPICEACPWNGSCAAAARGTPEAWPRKRPKPVGATRFGLAFILTRGDLVGLVRRPGRGLLGGMLGLPTTHWRPRPWSLAEALDDAPAPVAWRSFGGVRHVFTHFPLELDVYGALGAARTDELIWMPLNTALEAVPTVFAKALRLKLAADES